MDQLHGAISDALPLLLLLASLLYGLHVARYYRLLQDILKASVLAH
jgi:hypothetical protein